MIKQYGSRLSDYERQEIEKYPEIWYLGLESCKINAKPGTPVNCGYDDENGSYNKVSKHSLELLVDVEMANSALHNIETQNRIIRQTKLHVSVRETFNCKHLPGRILHES